MPDPNMTGMGKLVIQTSTARDALPVQYASVAVSESAESGSGKPPTLLFSALTDNSGRTPVFNLPAPSRTESQSPGGPIPYARYSVQVEHPGFQPANIIDVTVFDGVTSTLPVYLLPMTESGKTTSGVDIIPPPPLR